MEFDLKEVFSILDENGEGQIQLRRFVDVANNYYSDAEQLDRILKALDPNKTGFINFDQFSNGIGQISSLQGVSLKDVASDLTRLSRENSLVEDSDRRSLNQDGSTTTFNEYDVESDETFHQQNQNNKNSTTTNNKKKNNQSIVTTFDSSLSAEEEFIGVAEADSNHFSSDRIKSKRLSQTIKRTNPTEEIEQQLQETVDDLQKTVEVLTEQKQKTTDRLSKIQSENNDLKSRLLALEDRFLDLEGQQTRSTKSEQEKYAEYINQKDRTFSQEKEILQTSVMRINAIETELKQTQTANGQMKKDVKQLKEKLEDVDFQLKESQVRCNYLSEDNENLLEQLKLQRKELEDEKLLNSQLVERLSSETSNEIFGHSLNRTEIILKTSEQRIQDLDSQIRALKLENGKLKRENDELKERAIAVGIHEGQRLMANRDSMSYAAELEVLSKDELMSKLREQFSINDRLREYIERMLSVIIENNPQLLEVTVNGGAALSISSEILSKTDKKSSSSSSSSSSVPKQEIETSQSIKNDLTTTKQSNDKYCRLS